VGSVHIDPSAIRERRTRLQLICSTVQTPLLQLWMCSVLAMSSGLLQRQGVQRASTKYSCCRSGLFIACDSETTISLVVSHLSLPHFNSTFTSSPTASNPPTLRTLTYCPPLAQLQSADPLRPPPSMVQLIAVSNEEARSGQTESRSSTSPAAAAPTETRYNPRHA
jgi:hypothetical protein